MTLRAPFPWFGGKRLIASRVWERLGDVDIYCEPFAGSLSVLLGRPEQHVRRVEVVNDLDGFVANAWRAILHDPDTTTRAADWPVNENDLHARHAWLVTQRAGLVSRLEGDPNFFDAKIAGWWMWGLSLWIGTGFCAGEGAWTAVDGRLVRVRGAQQQGVTRQIPTRRHVPRQRSALHALSTRLQRVIVTCGDWSRVLTPATFEGRECGILLDPRTE